MQSDYRLVGAVLRVTFFWWVILSIIEFVRAPIDFFEAVVLRYYLVTSNGWLVLVIGGLALLGLFFFIWLERRQVLYSLKPSEVMGMASRIGPVPKPNQELKKVKPKDRLATQGENINAWIESQHVEKVDDSGKTKTVESAYLKLFYAVWDVYCANAHYPASHRRGGHANRSLIEHCHDVAEHSLDLIRNKGWLFTGVYMKRRGFKAIRIFTPNTPNAKLDGDDPLIPIIGLAHDIGKLIAYKVDKKGNIIQNLEEEANTLDDDSKSVKHDFIGPRILSRLPEFWDLNYRDRAAITLAIAHYHHPSDFPLNAYGLLFDERAAMLMALLIEADREVSVAEAKIAGGAAPNEMDEEDSNHIYKVFVELISEEGRINRINHTDEGKALQIGQKHEKFIAMSIRRLKPLLEVRLGLTSSIGEQRYLLINKLLNILKEKDLLYVEHNDQDFSDFLPLYRVSLYHDKKGTHMTTFAPGLLMKNPPQTLSEFESLGFLPVDASIPIIERVLTAHITVRDENRLDQLQRAAFGVDYESFSSIYEEEATQEPLQETHQETQQGPAQDTEKKAGGDPSKKEGGTATHNFSTEEMMVLIAEAKSVKLEAVSSESKPTSQKSHKSKGLGEIDDAESFQDKLSNLGDKTTVKASTKPKEEDQLQVDETADLDAIPDPNEKKDPDHMGEFEGYTDIAIHNDLPDLPDPYGQDDADMGSENASNAEKANYAPPKADKQISKNDVGIKRDKAVVSKPKLVMGQSKAPNKNKANKNTLNKTAKPVKNTIVKAKGVYLDRLHISKNKDV